MIPNDNHLSSVKPKNDCRRSPEYTTAKALLNDAPAIITWLLGSIILLHFGPAVVLPYVACCVLSVFGFSRILCTYCPLSGTRACPTKFGDIAAKLFKKRDEKEFSHRFKMFIPFLSLLWFVPFAGGVFLLVSEFSWLLLGMVVTFSVFGFVLVPIIPMLTACRKCPLRTECPWMRLAESRLRSKLVSHEEEHGTMVICPASGFRCSYCPCTFIGRCRKLEDFLKTGEWKE